MTVLTPALFLASILISLASPARDSAHVTLALLYGASLGGFLVLSVPVIVLGDTSVVLSITQRAALSTGSMQLTLSRYFVLRRLRGKYRRTLWTFVMVVPLSSFIFLIVARRVVHEHVCC